MDETGIGSAKQGLNIDRTINTICPKMSIFDYYAVTDMEVIFDNEQKPRGVFLPLEEWEVLKYGVNKASNLYKLMDELSHPDIFDMTASEFSQYMEPAAAEIVKNALDSGLYVSYPAGSELPGAFVHEYKNGKKMLVEIDPLSGKEHFLRNL
jgi:hypothetical protein